MPPWVPKPSLGPPSHIQGPRIAPCPACCPPGAALHPVSVQSVLKWLLCRGLCPPPCTGCWERIGTLPAGFQRKLLGHSSRSASLNLRNHAYLHTFHRSGGHTPESLMRELYWAALSSAPGGPGGCGGGNGGVPSSQRGPGATLRGPRSQEGPAGTVLQEVRGRGLGLHTHKGPGLDARGPGLRS